MIACVWKTVNVIACPGGLGKEGVWRSYAAVLVKRAFCGLTFYSSTSIGRLRSLTSGIHTLHDSAGLLDLQFDPFEPRSHAGVSCDVQVMKWHLCLSLFKSEPGFRAKGFWIISQSHSLVAGAEPNRDGMSERLMGFIAVPFVGNRC